MNTETFNYICEKLEILPFELYAELAKGDWDIESVEWFPCEWCIDSMRIREADSEYDEELCYDCGQSKMHNDADMCYEMMKERA